LTEIHHRYLVHDGIGGRASGEVVVIGPDARVPVVA
jgi:hypothetical protein